MPAQIITGVLSPVERELAETIARTTTDGWEPGRQGSGYEKLFLRGALEAEHPELSTLLERLRAHLEETLLGHTLLEWDAYLLRYREGSYIPAHRDENDDGRHQRLNALLTSSSAGKGELYVEGQRIDLAPGDGVSFRSDLVTHEVRPVRGERLVLSLGCVF